jgi:hypothetical protein
MLVILLQHPSRSPVSVCRTVWTRQNHFVAIEVTKPYFPMVWASVSTGRVSVAWQDDFSAHLSGPCNRSVDVVNLKPKKQSVSRRHVVRITDGSVMVFFFSAMQLHYQLAGMDQALVVRPAVSALASKQALIPPTARLDISNTNQRLWSHHLASP